MSAGGRMWGLMAEFGSADALLAGARRAHAAGYRRIEAYSSFPVEGLSEAIGFGATRVPLATLVGGIAGGLGGFFLQWYSAVVDFPINVAGHPFDSWPMFVPVTFELAVLGGAVTAVVAMFIGSGLPRLRHPVFGSPEFDLATRNRFFLCLRSDDPSFDPQGAARLLDELQPLRRIEVHA